MVSIQEIPTYVWAIMLAGVLAGVGVMIINEFESSSLTENSTAWTATQNATIGIANIMEQLPTVGTIVGVSLIVGVVVLLFVAFRGKETTY